MNVYGDPHKIEFFGFFVGAIQSVRPDFNGPPMDPPPLPFQLQDPERLRKEFATAGLKDIKVETITETTEFQTVPHSYNGVEHSRRHDETHRSRGICRVCSSRNWSDPVLHAQDPDGKTSGMPD
jgi:hypothetical protein